MAKNKKKNKTTRGDKAHRRLWYYLVLIGIGAVVIVFLRGNYGFIRYMQLRRQKQKLQQEIIRLEKKRDQLKKEIELLNSDYQYIKKILREKYRMGEEGEKIYFLAPSEKDKPK